MTPEISNIGRYQVRKELGRGGMATVFDAYDPRFERSVAIKVLPREFLHDPQFRARFEREAKTVALLEHPAIVPVYDFGEHDGQPYIVMQLMNGGSLADRLERGPIAPEEAVKILNRLAQALDVAHSKGIIHRDLKPGNVLFDQYGNAFLSDFGIARLKASGNATLTGSQIIGTPAYMSPEQIQGEKTIDGRSDIYALGVILFLMLSNQMPFQADTPAKVMIAHIIEPAPSILVFREDLPPGIDDVIDKALAKDPDDRYQTAAAMAEDFAEVVRASLAITRPRPVNDPAPPGVKAQTATRLSAPKTGPYAAKTAVSTPTLPPVSPTPQPVEEPVKSRPSWLLYVLGGVILFAILAGGGMLIANLSGQGQATPIAQTTPDIVPTVTETEVPPTPTLTLEPSPTEEVPAILPTDTPAPTHTATEAPPETPTDIPVVGPQPIGGAIQLAFVQNNDIWLINLDGTGLTQLTTDRSIKSNLVWTPDGKLLLYTTGTCIRAVTPEGVADNIACFQFIETLGGIAVSPDGTQLAVSLDNQLYIVPFDREVLNPGGPINRNDVIALATETCSTFAPYERNFVRQMQWSDDGLRMALKIIAVGTGVLQGVNTDNITIIEIGDCTRPPNTVDNFPVPRFEIENFEDRPEFTDWSWDGGELFTVTSHSTQRTGFGDFYLYRSNRFQGEKLNPIDGKCCYREVRWSPDGQYVLFVYQEFASNSRTEIYYVFFNDLLSGVALTPLDLPEFTNTREYPQPALRPAGSP
ncbi:MAG: hypothetical protein Fur0022_19630 [Anaerolineales bacterium]